MTVEKDLSISPSQLEAIKKLQKLIPKEDIPKHMNETFMYYRFLKAQNFDVDGAEKMLKKNLEWRKEYRMESILTEYEPPEVLEKYFSNFRLGFDKLECPFYYGSVGKYDPRGIHMAAKFADIERTLLTIAEEAERTLEETSKKLNKTLTGYTCICDCDGLTFAKATNKKGIETMIRLLKIPQENYPERVKHIFVINASSYFTLFFSVIKTFISQGVLNKIHVYGTDGWKDELLKLIDAKELPVFLGGTRTDPDGNPLCLTLVNIGGKVDEKYFINKSTRALRTLPNVKKIVLARASFSEIYVEVAEAGSVIEYEFETKTRDIGFGLFHSEVEDGEEKITELVPLLRLETEEFSETGMYKCEKAGKYIMLFDNSYSWVRSKEIYYLVTVRTPKEIEQIAEQ